MKMKKEFLLDLFVLLVIYAFLLHHFRPDLLLLETTTAGGDTPSHHYIVKYLKEYLLPKHRIRGWSPDWYAGFPFLHFYFPLTYLLMVLLSYFMPLVVAFKLVTILGMFLLPLFTLFSMKLLGFKVPTPEVAAVLTLIFLFSESFTFYGGNIPSTLAGEFSYSFSLSVMILLSGMLYKGVKEGKWLLRNSIALAVMNFSHLYTTSVFFFASSSLLVTSKDKEELKRRFLYLFLVFFIGFSLVAFWLLPFVAYSEYMSSVGWIQLKGLSHLFLDPFKLILVFAFFGVVLGVTRKDDRVVYLLSFVLVSLAYFFLLPDGHLFNGRYLPFYYLYSILLASYGISELDIFSKKDEKVKIFFVISLLFFVVFYVQSSINFIDYWIKWNYEGLESKQNWVVLRQLFDYLGSLPPGRVMHEYTASHDKYGSPRVLELIPYFSGKPVMEGLLMESAVLAPYHFWVQSVVSKQPSCPISYVGCAQLNLTKGLDYLRFLNVRYFVATSEEVKNLANATPGFKFLKSIGEFSVYEVEGVHSYVVPLSYEPVFVRKSNWKEKSLEWFRDVRNLDTVLVFDESGKDVDVRNLPKVPVNTSCQISEVVSNEEILIETDCIDKPLLVKVPYFPNWKVEGAKKIYLASPSFIVIYPTSTHVRIYYASTAIDLIGAILSVTSLFLMLVVSLWRKKFGLN